MKMPALRLRLQMGLVMSVVALTSVTFLAVSLLLFFAHAQQTWLEQQSPRDRQIFQRIEETENPKNIDETRVWNSSKDYLRQYVETHGREVVILFYLSIGASLLLGTGVGVFLAMRIVKPVEEVARAAQAVASGDLNFHPLPRGRWMGRELRSLTTDFNAMVVALGHADRELRDANAAIAHELRTPLTVLRGRLQGMRDGVFSRDDAQLEQLVGQVDDLTKVVEDLRVLSLISAGALPFELTLIDLGQVAREVLSALRPLLEEEGFVVISRICEAPVCGDAARLRQLILGVLDNYRRYARGGELAMEVSANANEAVLQIFDRGPGFKPGEEGRAFERFWRSEQSRSRDQGGSGLGLSVVMMIAKAHGWSASIRNRHSGGAVFELRAKLAQSRL